MTKILEVLLKWYEAIKPYLDSIFAKVSKQTLAVGAVVGVGFVISIVVKSATLAAIMLLLSLLYGLYLHYNKG